jgi:hypothetical protein
MGKRKRLPLRKESRKTCPPLRLRKPLKIAPKVERALPVKKQPPERTLSQGPRRLSRKIGT